MNEMLEAMGMGRRMGPGYATCHALKRMRARGIQPETVRLVLHYGRHVWTRGACIYVLGRREVVRLLEEGIDASAASGVHVVCSPDGDVITTYRNHDFRGLRPRKPRRPWSRGYARRRFGRVA